MLIIWISRKLIRIIYFIYIILILILSAIPLTTNAQINYLDKIEHIIAFILYFIFSFYSFPKLNIIFHILLGILFGLLIEIIQSFVPFREFSVFDLIADIVGLITGYIIIRGSKNKFIFKT